MNRNGLGENLRANPIMKAANGDAVPYP